MSKIFKELLLKIGFIPKDGAVGIYCKEYKQHNNYCINIDFTNEKINYGELITSGSKTTQNFSQEENWVVLECVDRLLEKGYKPQNIILEKTWAAGHGTSGRLDICVTRDDGTEYLLIECKTFGKEFDKALAKLCKDGGQLFTYFKFSNKADVIMLYTSKLKRNEIVYKNEIVKIEDDYRVGDVKDFYEKWNKLLKDNGIFEYWVCPYCFESKTLTLRDLKPINQEDSSFIFNQFLEILRHNVVSDKGNAFNKIFTLFLCKVYDETSKRDDEELDFQWKEGVDNDVSFQLRLTDLYKKGMYKFLTKIVSDFNENDFENKYKDLSEDTKREILKTINTLRLEKNNEFAIKEVYDHDSFVENAKIVKEVVELLQGYRIRYNKRQQYLSDFFELLLTTGLKQEAGQFFTPVPIAQFIIRSLPLNKIVDEKLKSKDGELLPYMIDYAAGSGHFITEYMHEVQNIINQKDPTKYISGTQKELLFWQNANYEWATKYVYGVEKDYRLVKVGKVGCYLHGDGLANVILSDGLGNFVNTKDYKGRLRKSHDDNTKDNQQFDILLSNPPYSVSAFINTTRDYYTEEDFELYNKLTDNSSEIECLFVERTKQLLKDGGVAGVILPSSILTNSGIYTKTRELILKYFEIVAITELGSNTFMATGTNTVVLFLRRRNNYECINLQKDVDKFFKDFKDVTINNIEMPISKYVNYVWAGLTFDDYVTLLEQNPNDKVKTHDLFKEYSQKIISKTEKEFWSKVLELEKEKIYYFIIVYSQKLVVVKTGEKDAEKQFLGYEFSNRRGSEGIHAIQRNRTIEECTKLFDIDVFDNPQKASTYIYRAFENDLDFSIDETLQNNISRMNLLDMMTFDRGDFEKVINVKAKKKLKIESKWDNKSISEIVLTIESGSRPAGGVKNNSSGVYSLGGEHIDNSTGFLNITKPKYVSEDFYKNSSQGKIRKNDILICKDGALTGKIALVRNELDGIPAMINEHVFLLRCQDVVTQKYLFNVLFSHAGQTLLKANITGAAQGGLNLTNLKTIRLPLPPFDIQQKIVDEIEKIEKKHSEITIIINNLKKQIDDIFNFSVDTQKYKLGQLLTLEYGKALPKAKRVEGFYPVVGSNGVDGYHNEYLLEGPNIIVGRKGSVGKVNWIKENCTPIDTCFFVKVKPEVLDFRYCYYLLKSVKLERFNTGLGPGGLNRNTAYNIEVRIPVISNQQKIVAQIEKLEKQIAEAQAVIDGSKQQKQEILMKYL